MHTRSFRVALEYGLVHRARAATTIWCTADSANVTPCTLAGDDVSGIRNTCCVANRLAKILRSCGRHSAWMVWSDGPWDLQICRGGSDQLFCTSTIDAISLYVEEARGRKAVASDRSKGPDAGARGRTHAGERPLIVMHHFSTPPKVKRHLHSMHVASKLTSMCVMFEFRSCRFVSASPHHVLTFELPISR